MTCQENALAVKTRQVQTRRVFENLSGLLSQKTLHLVGKFPFILLLTVALPFAINCLVCLTNFLREQRLRRQKLVLQHHKPGFVNLMMASAMIARANDYQCI